MFYDLADKELARLIANVAKPGVHVAIILDCCHSGSGTRNLRDQLTAVRLAPEDEGERPLHTFYGLESRLAEDVKHLIEQQSAGAPDRPQGEDGSQSGWPAGPHVLMAACSEYQLASEYQSPAGIRGAFSYFLVDALCAATGPITYRDLFARTNSLVVGAICDQEPQLESLDPNLLDAPFLGGAVRPAEISYPVSFQLAAGGWVVEAGALHGLPAPTNDEPLEFLLYPFDSTPEIMRDAPKAKGKAKVIKVGPTLSTIELSVMGEPSPKETFKAVISRLPLPRLPVRIEGEEAGVALARNALATAGPQNGVSSYVRACADDEAPEFRLIAGACEYRITRPADDRPLVAEITGYTPDKAALAIARLEHIARWVLTLRLENDKSTIRPEEIEVKLFKNDQELKGSVHRFDYKLKDGKLVPAEFKIVIRNTGKGGRTLYVALLDLPETYGIFANLQPAGCIELPANSEVWANQNRPITARIPKELVQRGITELTDHVKLIVCTTAFDARRLAQKDLDQPRAQTREVVIPPPKSGLDHLMERLQTRHLDTDEPESLDDWWTTLLVFTTVRPPDAQPIPDSPDSEADLGDGVRIKGHAGLTAKARLVEATVASRSVGIPSVPDLLENSPNATRFVLASKISTRGEPAAPMSVLELRDVEDHESVTPAAPLRLETRVSLSANEQVMPYAWDGDFFLPLGHSEATAGGGTEIVIERLPTPTERGKRSLTGSIRIFFQKVICHVLGRQFQYPILAATDLDASKGKEEVVYERDRAKVGERVANAKRVLLLIHGIIGDTLELRRGMRRAKLKGGQPIDSAYDLILTCDYENLNTEIEKIAKDLKERLEGVGLKAGHGKELTVVAHSMGGLVARRLIEFEGGHEIVSRLIMCGTPNGGSPWPTAHDWVVGALAFGLNRLAAVAWPAGVLGWLVAGLERLDVNLDQMQPDSPFLATLYSGHDPGIPYLMLAGNTSLVPAALQVDKDGSSPAARLLARVMNRPLLHTLTDPLFRGDPNDIAVSIASMKLVPAARRLAYDVREIACDHISYFHDPRGLEALAKVLGPG